MFTDEISKKIYAHDSMRKVAPLYQTQVIAVVEEILRNEMEGKPDVAVSELLRSPTAE